MSFAIRLGGMGKQHHLKGKVADSGWWTETHSDLLFQVIRLLSQLFHLTHGDVCQARPLQQMETIDGKEEKPEKKRQADMNDQQKPLPFARSSDPGTNPWPCLPRPTFQSTLTLSKSACFCKSKWPASTLQSFTNTRERTEKPAEHIRARLRPGSHAPPPYMDACCMFNIQA